MLAEIPKSAIKVGYAVDSDDWLIDIVKVPTKRVAMKPSRLNEWLEGSICVSIESLLL